MQIKAACWEWTVMVYELMERLNWISLLQEFSRVPKGSHLGDM